MEFSEATADRSVLAGVAEIATDRFALVGVAIDFDLKEERGLRRILLIQFDLEHRRQIYKMVA